MDRLAGKVAIITGAARGMGAVTARLFADEGARVVATDIDEANGAALARSIGDAALFLRHDVTDEESWRAVVAAAAGRFGGVDILVNNAGILQFGLLTETSKADFERTIAINLTGVFLGIKAAAPPMVAQGRGAIVNISSTGGLRSTNASGAYSASKYGVRGLTQAASLELGPLGVRVNAVLPGGVNTQLTNPDGLSAAEIDSRYKGLPLQRAGKAEEVARATLFLASDEASFCSGTELLVDGGSMSGRYHPFLPGAPAQG